MKTRNSGEPGDGTTDPSSGTARVDADLELDPASGAIVPSPRLNVLLGYPETRPLTIDEFYARVHPDDAPGLRAFAQAGGSLEREFRVLLPDGTVCWLHARGEAPVERGGVPVRVRIALHEITKRKRSEAAARESEDRYRALAATSPVAILVNCGGACVYANDAAARLLHAGSPRELIGRTPLELVAPDYRELAMLRFSQVLERRDTLARVRYRWRRLDGGEVDVDVAAAWVQWQGEDAVQVVAHDITAEILVEEALRQSRALLTDQLEDATRLQNVSARLIEADDAGAIYRHLLSEAVRLMRAAGGSVRQFGATDGRLDVVAAEALPPDVPQAGPAGAAGAWWPPAQALNERRRVVVEDVASAVNATGDALDAYRRAGIRAMQSTPLIARDGTVVGVMSTHWNEPYRPAERELGLLDVLARQAADLLERHRAQERLAAIERRQSFLLNLSDELRAVRDPEEAPWRACRLLGEHLGADRVHYGEHDVRGAQVVVVSDWFRTGLRGYVGTYPLAAFGETPLGLGVADGTLAVADTATCAHLSQSARVTCHALGVGAFVTTPLQRGGQVVWTLSVVCGGPRAWTADDIRLIEEVADRTGAALDRARAERALKESRATLQAFYDSSPLMMGIVEIRGDAIVTMEMNDAAARFFRVPPRATGASADSPALPADASAVWLAHYRRAQYRAQPARFEYEHDGPDGPRWVAAIVVHLGTAADSRGRFSFVAEDVTERKRVEGLARESEARRAFLLSLDEALQPLGSAAEVLREACRVVRRALGVDRVLYAEAAGDDRYTVAAADTAQIGGAGLADFELAQYARRQHGDLRAGHVVAGERAVAHSGGPATAWRPVEAIDAPLVRQGALVALMSSHCDGPRTWTPADLTLLAEAAERTWAAAQRAGAYAALRDSEDRYRSLFRAMDQGYFLADTELDAAGRCVDLLYLDENPAAVALVGGRSFVGRRLSEISPDYEPYWYEIFGRVARTGVGQRLERCALPDGRWYDFQVFKVGGPASRRIAVVFQDVSERKRREADVAFLADIERVFARADDPWELMAVAGGKIGAYLAVDTCNFCNVDDPADRITVEYGWRRASAPDLLKTFPLSRYCRDEFRRASRDGETVVINDTQSDRRTVAEPCAELGIGGFLSVPFREGARWTNSLTVTTNDAREWQPREVELFAQVARRLFPLIARARTLTALRASEERFRSLIDSVRDYAIFMLDADGRVIEWTDGAASVFGYPAHEVLGRHASMFHTPEDAATGSPQAELEEAERVGRAEREAWRVCKGGRRIWANEVVTEVRGADGGLRGYIKISRNLTERRRVEQALADAARHKDDFLAMLSHELRNPLAPIRNSVYVLRHVRGESEAARHAQGVIERQTQHLARLVDDLLDVTRISRGRIELRHDRVELRDLVRRASEDFRAVLEDRHIGFAVELPQDRVWCLGDATRLNQAIGNLLTNAAKFTVDGDASN